MCENLFNTGTGTGTHLQGIRRVPGGPRAEPERRGGGGGGGGRRGEGEGKGARSELISCVKMKIN